MTDQRYFDFDNFMQEQEEQPIIIKIFGQEEELPASLPASMVLSIMRMQKAKNGNIPESEVLSMAEAMFGKDRLKKWCDNGLTMAGLEVLIKETTKLYMGNTKVEDENTPRKSPTRRKK